MFSIVKFVTTNIVVPVPSHWVDKKAKTVPYQEFQMRTKDLSKCGNWKLDPPAGMKHFAICILDTAETAEEAEEKSEKADFIIKMSASAKNQERQAEVGTNKNSGDKAIQIEPTEKPAMKTSSTTKSKAAVSVTSQIKTLKQQQKESVQKKPATDVAKTKKFNFREFFPIHSLKRKNAVELKLKNDPQFLASVEEALLEKCSNSQKASVEACMAACVTNHFASMYNLIGRGNFLKFQDLKLYAVIKDVVANHPKLIDTATDEATDWNIGRYLTYKRFQGKNKTP